jgi:hypothetical protein
LLELSFPWDIEGKYHKQISQFYLLGNGNKVHGLSIRWITFLYQLMYITVGTDLGTDNSGSRTDYKHTTTDTQQPGTNNKHRQRHPTIYSWHFTTNRTTNNKQHPPTGTPNNQQWALYNQPDNQQQTTTTDRDTRHSIVGTLQPTLTTNNKQQPLTGTPNNLLWLLPLHLTRKPTTNNCH